MKRPDPSLAPAQVLKRWLPERFAAMGGRMPPDCPKLRITVRDDQEITDVLFVASEQELDVLEAFDEDDADFWVRLTAADFRALLHGDPDLPPLVPSDKDVMDLMIVDASDLDRFRQLSGRLAVQIVGKKRRRFCLDVSFGEAGFKAGRPKSTVTIDGPALEAVINGTKPPLAALLEGRIKMEGDRALAMQALMLIVTRTTRK